MLETTDICELVDVQFPKLFDSLDQVLASEHCKEVLIWRHSDVQDLYLVVRLALLEWNMELVDCFVRLLVMSLNKVVI